METKEKKRLVDDYQLLLVCCVFVSVLWVLVFCGACVTVLDQVIFVAGPLFFMLVAFVVKRLRLITKLK
jgi:uncharacterized membrane protein YgcG